VSGHGGPEAALQKRQQPWLLYPSPLRYPGGKRKLAPFMKAVFELNELGDGDYVEPYAGGAGVALELLFDEYARNIHINDVDRGVFALWVAARDRTDELCALMSTAKLDMDEYRRQRAIYSAPDADPLELAFATLFLNRTNRSGIIASGGPIGGIAQAGAWRLDARFHADDLIRRLQKIGRYASRIHISGLDAAAFLAALVPGLPAASLVYLDPPYYVKGGEALYTSFYGPAEHASVASCVASLERSWIVSYDNVPEIRGLYAAYRSQEYGVRYTAKERYVGREVMFFSDGLRLPDVVDPMRTNASSFAAH
jgi:DNA adenine methylase